MRRKDYRLTVGAGLMMTSNRQARGGANSISFPWLHLLTHRRTSSYLISCPAVAVGIGERHEVRCAATTRKGKAAPLTVHVLTFPSLSMYFPFPAHDHAYFWVSWWCRERMEKDRGKGWIGKMDVMTSHTAGLSWCRHRQPLT